VKGGLPSLRETRAVVSYCSSYSGVNLPQDPELDNIDRLKSSISRNFIEFMKKELKSGI
jgi:hypothetical protein